MADRRRTELPECALDSVGHMRHSAPVKLKVMPDYQCWPLWREDIIDNVDPASLPISDALRLQLLGWAQKFDDILVWDDPASSKFASPKAEAAFEAEGRELATQLQRELAAVASVRYWRDVAAVHSCRASLSRYRASPVARRATLSAWSQPNCSPRASYWPSRAHFCVQRAPERPLRCGVAEDR